MYKLSYPAHLVIFFFVFISNLSAQQKADTLVRDSSRKKLPFAIASEKKLPAEELAEKKEGVYLTGVPDISSDPVNGIGYGGEGTLYFNGKRTDPFFEYTPYRGAVTFALFNTTRNQREFKVGWDIPYVFDSKWRLRGEVAFEVNPNLLYFGIDENSLKHLSYYPNGDSTIAEVHNANYTAYENSLRGTNQFYNTYTKQEAIINLSAERSYLQGRLRWLIGYEIAWLKLTPFSGHSMLRDDFNSGKIRGVGANSVSFIQTGLIYDTRDLETDPSNGTFAEITNELSLKAIGSNFTFNKTFAHYNFYKKLFPKYFKKLIIAGRIAMGYTAGKAPFFEYQDQWTSEGSIEGLGGGQTIRGYKQSRFLAPVMQFSNLEMRYRFAQFKFLKQGFAFSAVPFFDAGGVWNSMDRVITHLNNLRTSEGLGLRIAWNVNTILRFDYAFSKEDHQFFFQLQHAF